jgi:hypothetical protein
MISVQPQDIGSMLGAVGAIKNPVGTALGFLGLSDSEQRAGVPTWAWMVVAFGVGTYVGMQYGDKLKRYL